MGTETKMEDEEDGTYVVIAEKSSPGSAVRGRYMMQRTRNSPWEEVECKLARRGNETRLREGQVDCGQWSCQQGVWEPQNEAAVHNVTAFQEEAGRFFEDARAGRQRKTRHAGTVIVAWEYNEGSTNFPRGVTAYAGEQVVLLAARAVVSNSETLKGRGNRMLSGRNTAAASTTATTATGPAQQSKTHECTDRCMRGDKLLDLETEEVVEARGQPYVALSYVWRQWKPEMMAAVKATAGCRYLWMDQRCIDQLCGEHKAEQIPTMRKKYGVAQKTLVVMPEIQRLLPEDLLKTDGPWDKEYFREHVKELAAELIGSDWMSRVWTWQEAMASRCLEFLTGAGQILDARRVAILLSYGPNVPVTRYAIMHPAHIATGTVSLPVSIVSQGMTLYNTGFSASDTTEHAKWMGTDAWGDEITLGAAMRATAFRQATLDNDSLYGVVGLIDPRSKVDVSYSISYGDALAGLAASEGVHTDMLLHRRSSTEEGRCWMPNDKSQTDCVGTSWHMKPTAKGHLSIQGSYVCNVPVMKVAGIRDDTAWTDKGQLLQVACRGSYADVKAGDYLLNVAYDWTASLHRWILCRGELSRLHKVGFWVLSTNDYFNAEWQQVGIGWSSTDCRE